MGPRWAVVDEMVHELGSLRARIQEAEADPDVAEAEVTYELRAGLARATDDIHLIIGGDDAMVSRAWRSISEAREMGRRALEAVQNARRTRAHSASLRTAAEARKEEARRHVAALSALLPENGARPRAGAPEKRS